MAPMSSACVVTAMMWLSSRVISAKRTGEGAQRGERGAERGNPPPPDPFPGRQEAVLTSDPLRPEGWADVEQLLHGQGVRLLVAHHGDVVQAVEIGQGLAKGSQKESWKGPRGVAESNS